MTSGIPAKRIRRRPGPVTPRPAPPAPDLQPSAHGPVDEPADVRAAPGGPVSEEPAERPRRRRRDRSPLGRPGWTVVAAKEFADHLLSARFVVLLLVLALVAIVPLYLVTGLIRDAAEQATDVRSLFLLLFTVPPEEQIDILRVNALVAIVAPLLGVAFGFDAVNGERAQGTLPRLLSQPIHRDDVINGKFAAGLAVIGLVLTAVVVLVAGFGLFRLGIVPSGTDVLRIIAWLLVTMVYVSLWLAFALLLSVLLRRAATSALIGFGVWIVITIFGTLIISLVLTALTPIPAGGSIEEQLSASQLQQLIARLSPNTLYFEATRALLEPGNVFAITPSTFGQYVAASEQIEGFHYSFEQSLLLVWPQIVALVALTVVCFAAAYIAFMRQEVRA